MFAVRSVLLGAAALLGLLAAVGTAHAQTQPDSSRVSYSEEVADTVRDTFKEKYDYLVRAHVEETELWKLDLLDASTNFLIPEYGARLAYERKLSAPFSAMAEVYPLLEKRDEGRGNRYYAFLGTQVSGRYYYNQRRRIQKGKSANNFSANYLSLLVRNDFTDRINSVAFDHRTSVVWGLQRRLGRYGFFDFNFGVVVLPELQPDLRLRLGLALGR